MELCPGGNLLNQKRHEAYASKQLLRYLGKIGWVFKLSSLPCLHLMAGHPEQTINTNKAEKPGDYPGCWLLFMWQMSGEY